MSLIAAITSGCQSQGQNAAYEVVTTPFGTLPDGRAVDLYTVTTPSGIVMKVTNYGGIITHLMVPDATGTIGDVVLGYDNLDAYLASTPYFGAIIGRYGNRIANGRFSIDGTAFTLAANNGQNHLHGGITGFDKVLWAAEAFSGPSGAGVIFSYTSADGEEGYPGALQVQVTYTLGDDGSLGFDYAASTDKSTPVNLTQHSYFNLAGPSSTSILGHDLQIAASRFTPVDDGLIPTGELADVTGTPFDFRAPHAIGARIEADNEQMVRGLGYDHNWVLDGRAGGLKLAARVVEPSSGRVMEVRTEEPGIQFYSGNFLDGTLPAKGGGTYAHRSGFCLETQHFPDSPNQPGFPSTLLEPGETYRTRTVYTFSVIGSGGKL
ncbi:MAG: aldose 1-epimerase [Thalassolituus oleivorans]|jgi:aldose 1-epimerase